MAIYHCCVKIIGRSSGRSSVAAAAYRAGQKMRNERDGKLHDYTLKQGVVHSEIMLPANAPKEYRDRKTLWNTVEKCERRYDAQTAREVQVALPVELSLEDNIKVVQEYINENFIDKGMCADFSIHDKGDGNPHAHIMLTMRDVDESGFAKKNRTWNKKEYLEEWRENWANVCKRSLEEKGEQARVDHRSLEAQGLERESTIHEGRSYVKWNWNQDVIKRNERFKPVAVAQYMNELNECYTILKNHDAEIQEQEQELSRIVARSNDIHKRANDLQKQYDNLQQARALRDNMGRLQNKRAINANIERLEQSYSHSWDYFERNFRVPPDQVNYELKRLKHSYNKVRKDYDYNNEQSNSYSKRTFEMEYKRQLLLTEIRPDKGEILAKVYRTDSRLNRITEDDYRELAKGLRPSQVRILNDKLNNHAKQRERNFYGYER